MTRPDPDVDDPAAVQAADDQAARVESDRLNTTDEGRPMTGQPPTQRVVQTGSLATGETFGVYYDHTLREARTSPAGWVAQLWPKPFAGGRRWLLTEPDLAGMVNVVVLGDDDVADWPPLVPVSPGPCDRCPHRVADHDVGGCHRCHCSLPHGGH